MVGAATGSKGLGGGVGAVTLSPMFWRLFSGHRLEEAGARARRVHSVWLSRALQRGRVLPRIPTKPVSDGGFAAIMTTREGSQWAQEWWDEALEQAEDT